MTTKDIFSAEILAEVSNVSLADVLATRQDDVIGVTIDGETSKDLDDAIYVEVTEEGGYNVQVSIADVAALVSPNSQLFAEALNRVQTQYRATHNIPMLPPELSEDQLSLLPDQQRPALTFDIQVSAGLDVQQIKIRETVLHSKRRFNYAEVDEIISHQPDDPDYALLVACNNLAQQLLEKRRTKGALAIYDLKQGIFTNEEGQVVPLDADRANKGNLIVQELMILTNQATANYFAEQDIPILFRNHTVKQSTPDRDEIIAQFNAAIINPTILDTLSNRSALWFNRATYDSVLKGHFGLNEVAYTHVTSPIRRIPDLINQQIIKSFITQQGSPYSRDGLTDLATGINEKITEMKDEKVEYFREKAAAKARHQAVNAHTERLLNMDSNDFRQVLKQVCRTGIMGEEFENALMIRFDTNTVDVSHLYIIFFEMVGDGGVWSRIRDRALLHANDNPGFNSQLLNLQTQKGNLSRYEIEIKQDDDGFIARVIASSNAGYFSTPVYAKGANKKDAQHRASYNFLVGYLDHSLVSPHETQEPSKANVISALENLGVRKNDGANNSEENYVGRLNEYCAGKNGWAMPQYAFEKSGPSHQPLITCECVLQTGHDPVTASGIGTNKKVAKQVAARNILEIIFRDGVEFAAEPPPGVPPKQDTNHVGSMNELCQRHRWPMPTYDFEQSGPSHNPHFTCHITVQTDEGPVIITGEGSSKKVAKQSTAKLCLDHFEQLGITPKAVDPEAAQEPTEDNSSDHETSPEPEPAPTTSDENA